METNPLTAWCEFSPYHIISLPALRPALKHWRADSCGAALPSHELQCDRKWRLSRLAALPAALICKAEIILVRLATIIVRLLFNRFV